MINSNNNTGHKLTGATSPSTVGTTSTAVPAILAQICGTSNLIGDPWAHDVVIINPRRDVTACACDVTGDATIESNICQEFVSERAMAELWTNTASLPPS